VALIQKNTKIKKHIFRANQKKLGSLRKLSVPRIAHPSNGDDQPARKNIEVKAAIKIIFAYSARKNTAKATPEYST
jgi:hypothetical protein